MPEFTLPGPELAGAVAWAAKLMPARPTTPVLAGVLLDAETVDADDPDAATGRLTVSVFDFDTCGVTVCDADVTEPGRSLVSGNLLAAVTRTLGARDAAHCHHQPGSANPSDATLTLDVGKAAGWELPTLDHRDYPQLPLSPDPIAEVDAQHFAAELARVLPAAGTDPTQANINGVYLVAEAGGPLTLAATDRYRLALAELDYDSLDDTGVIAEMLIPLRLARHIAAVARETTGPLQLLADNTMAGVAAPRRRVAGRLYDASVRWRAIALDETTADAGRALVATTELRRAIDRAATVLGPGESLSLDFTADGLTVAPTLGGKGRASHHADLDEIDGGDRHVGVAAGYITEALESLGAASQVEVRFSVKPWSPILLRPCDDGEVVPGFRHIVAQQRQAVVEAAA